MINLRQTTDLREMRPDVPVGIPKAGVGLQWFPKQTNMPAIVAHIYGQVYEAPAFSDPYNYGTLDAELHSNHVTGSIFVPVANGSGDNLTVEVPSSSLPLNISLGKYTFGSNTSSGSTPNKIIASFDKTDNPGDFGGPHTHALVANSGSVSTGFVNAADTPSPGNFYQIRLISKRGSSPALFAHLNGRQPVAVDTTGDGSADLAAFVLPSGYTHYSDVLWGLAFVKSPMNSIFAGVMSNDISAIKPFINTEPGVCFYGGESDGGGWFDQMSSSHRAYGSEGFTGPGGSTMDMGISLVDWNDIHTSSNPAGGNTTMQHVAQTGLYGGFGGAQTSQPVNLNGTCHAPIPGTTANNAAGVVAENAGIAYLHVLSKDTASTTNALHLIHTPVGISIPDSNASFSAIQRYEEVQQDVVMRSRVEVPLTAHWHGNAASTGDLSNIFQFYWAQPAPGAASVTFTFTGVVANNATITLIDNGHSAATTASTVTKTFEVQSSASASGGRTKIDTAGVSNATAMAVAFCTAVNSETTLDIRASNSAGAVTLTQGYQGTSGGGTMSGNTTISFPDIGSGTTESAWNAAVSGSMPTAFSSGATDSETAKYKNVKVVIQGWKLNG